MDTAIQDIYIISAIKDAWNSLNRGEIDMNIFQSLDVQEVDEYGIPSNSIHERVDTTVVSMDDIEPNRSTNTNVIAVVFRHYHKQQRKDNYGCIIYIK